MIDKQPEKKKQVSGSVLNSQAEYINQRAERLDWTPSAFTAKLVEWWFDQGCPPVSKVDSLLPRLPYNAENHLHATPPPPPQVGETPNNPTRGRTPNTNTHHVHPSYPNTTGFASGDVDMQKSA
jgi:hypothetical protein